WLYLREVLGQVRGCKAKHKLLVVEIMQSYVAPRFGVLADDVAARTEALVKKATDDDPTLLVLLPCAPGQTALCSEDLRHTVFAYYVERGLLGAADGYNESQTRDGQVTVRELTAFLQARVDRWAIQNRATRQTPTLVGTADDFALLAVRGQA